MWHLDVPKILHIYWGGGKLIYMRYLTVKTFMRFNPDWIVVFWYPIHPYKGKSWGIELSSEDWDETLCKDYLPELLKLKIIKSPIDFDSVNIHKNIAEVHKNDYIRINALWTYGGVWSDSDIIYFKPIDELVVNKPENKDKEVFVCIGDYGHSTGFNMAKPDSKFFGKFTRVMGREYRHNGYQCWGPDLFNKYFKSIEDVPGGVNLSMDVVYAHDCHRVDELINGSAPRFTKESIGCHWYGGNQLWGKFINETRGGETNLPQSIIGNLIKNGK